MLARDRVKVFCLSADGTIQWKEEIAPPRLARAFSGRYPTGSLTAGPDGSVAAITDGAYSTFDGSRGTRSVWVSEPQTPWRFRELVRFRPREAPSKMLWSDDGARLFVSALTFQGRDSSPASETLYEITLDGSTRTLATFEDPGIYSVRRLTRIDRDGWLYSYVFFEDSTGGVDGFVRTNLVDGMTEPVGVHLGNHNGEGWPFASQIEPRLTADATAVYTIEDEGRVVVRYSLPTLERTVVREMDRSSVAWFVQPSPDGKWLLVATASAEWWRDDTGPTLLLETATLRAARVEALGERVWWEAAWSPDGRSLALRFRNTSQGVFDVPSGRFTPWPRTFDQILGWVG